MSVKAITAHEKFQSTRPARGATSSKAMVTSSEHISIHAPREGRDAAVFCKLLSIYKFQSTRPARGATYLSSCQ